MKLTEPIKKADVSATIRAIPAGRTRAFAAVDLGDFATVRQMVYRINALDNANYKVTTADNGVTITITNNSTL